MINNNYVAEITSKFSNLLKEQYLDKIIEERNYEISDDPIAENYNILALFYKRLAIFENYLSQIIENFLNKNGKFYYCSNPLYAQEDNNAEFLVEKYAKLIIGKNIKDCVCNNVFIVVKCDCENTEICLNVLKLDSLTKITHCVIENKTREFEK